MWQKARDDFGQKNKREPSSLMVAGGVPPMFPSKHLEESDFVDWVPPPIAAKPSLRNAPLEPGAPLFLEPVFSNSITQ